MDQEQQQNTNQQFTTPDTNQTPPPPAEPPKAGKKGVVIAIIVGALVILGIIGFVIMNSGKSNESANQNSDTDTASKTTDSKYQTYDVTDKQTGITFSVSFYKGAATTEKNGRTFLTAGEEGSQSSIYLVGGKEGKIDCGSAPSMTMRLNGESTTVCYKEDGTQYGGYVTVKGMTAQLNLAGQKPIEMSEAKTIMEGTTFK